MLTVGVRYDATVLTNIGTTDLGNYTGYPINNDNMLFQANQFTGQYGGSTSTQLGIPIPGAEFKMLDRSAHSFINRLVIRSQGTEIERIE
jgi:hypothetical protein